MFKLTTFYYENDYKANIAKRVYVTVKTGLTFVQAKAERAKDHSLQIVKEQS